VRNADVDVDAKPSSVPVDKPYIDWHLCTDCGTCREVCPPEAIVIALHTNVKYEVWTERCTGCGGPDRAPCVRWCPSPGSLVWDAGAYPQRRRIVTP
jgi:ferredoxin